MSDSLGLKIDVSRRVILYSIVYVAVNHPARPLLICGRVGNLMPYLCQYLVHATRKKVIKIVRKLFSYLSSLAAGGITSITY